MSSGKAFVRWEKITPYKLGLNGVSLVAGSPITSSSFNLACINQLQVYINLTRNAATAVTFYLESSIDGGTTWYRHQTSVVAAGTETLTDHTVSKTVAASDTWTHKMPELGGSDGIGRLVFDSTAGNANDTVIVTLYVGVSV